MPRPKQRRAADERKNEKLAKRHEKEEAAKAKERQEKRDFIKKSTMDWDTLPSTSAPRERDPNDFPEVDPDTKAYFKELSDRIRELENLGHGQEHEEFEDERVIILRRGLESLTGHELTLAADQETSIILETFLHAMDDVANRVLAHRFLGSYEKLFKHRFASHVIQTLLGRAGQIASKEAQGIVAEQPSGTSGTLPTMTELIVSMSKELEPHVHSIMWDSFGSHALRTLFRVLSGLPAVEAQSKGVDRSKKSRQFRNQQQGIDSNFLDTTQENTAPKRLLIPKPFSKSFQKLSDSLVKSIDEELMLGEGIRKAANDAIASPVIRLLVELECTSSKGPQPGRWTDHLLWGIIEQSKSDFEISESDKETLETRRDEFIAGMVRSPVGSPVMETVIKQAPQELFNKLWKTAFISKMERLVGNSIANFVVAAAVPRLEEVELNEFVTVLTGLPNERRGEWIDNARTGVLRALLDRSAQIAVAEEDASTLVLDTFQFAKSDASLIPCVLTLNRREFYNKLPEKYKVKPTIQGSLLLQSWLQLHSPHQQIVVDSLNSSAVDALDQFMRDPISSRFIDTFLSSSAVQSKDRRKFLMSLIGHYHTIADDRIGSRVVERCWEVADVYLKDKIVASLVKHAKFLQESAYGHYFARKLDMPLWERRREDWKQKQNRILNEKKQELIEKTKKEQIAEAAQSRKRDRPTDEVDEIFKDSGKKKKSANPTKATSKPSINSEGMGLEEIFGAIKASVM